MKIVLIKYPAGNIQSVCFSLERIGVFPYITDIPEEIKIADKIIFPGVGEAQTAMKYLRKKKLDLLIPNLKQPVLGICLGLQLFCKFSEENNTNCLGIFNLKVKKFHIPLYKVKKNFLIKIPQIGWNTIHQLKNPIFKEIPENTYQYFVHSYYAPLSKYTIAQSKYIFCYSAALQKKNFYAVQFHPEKSAQSGQKILENFIRL